MKTLCSLVALCFLTTVASAQELTWPELTRRPEFWPEQCAVKKAMKFQSGDSIAVGQKVNVIDVQSSQVVLETLDGKSTFAAKPDDTDALVAARAAYAKLSPAERELTYAALLRRPELWPYRVVGKEPFDLGGAQKIPKGTELILVAVEGNDLLVGSEKFNTSFAVRPQQTDLMTFARKVLAGKKSAPSRIAAELQGKLVDPITGKPTSLETNTTARYFVFYRGAGWCGPCREFSPTLVKAYNELKPKYPDFEVIFLSDDNSMADMQKYVKEEKFPWRAIPQQRLKELNLVTPHLGRGIPQVVIVDPTGKLLVNSDQVTRPGALKQLEALLKKPVQIQ